MLAPRHSCTFLISSFGRKGKKNKVQEILRWQWPGGGNTLTQLQQCAGEPSPGCCFVFFLLLAVQSSLCTIHVSHFALLEAVTAVFPHSSCPILSCPFLLLYHYVRVPLTPLSAESHRPTFMSCFFSLSYGGGSRGVFRLILAATQSNVALQFPARQRNSQKEK